MAEAAERLDTTAAEAYEKFLVPTLNEAPAREAVEIAAPRPGEKVLDVACGTGIVARLAAPRIAPSGAIAGLDFDPAMVAVAQKIVPNPPGVSVTWHCAGAQEMPFENATFDMAFCMQGLQYFPDCVAVLTEIRRVMKQGGRFVAVVWRSLEECRGQYAIAQALERRKVDAASVRKAYSWGNPDRVRKYLGEAGYQKVDLRSGSMKARYPSVRQFVEGFASGSISSRAAISRVPEEERTEFFADIDRSLRQYEDKDGVALPLGYLVIIARP
jgi:ubiquinone/menaquinone biosynthesis C-methylase UbiE